MKYEVLKETVMPGGGKVTVTIRSSAPIDERDYLILRPGAAVAAGECLASIANALRPPDSPEIKL